MALHASASNGANQVIAAADNVESTDPWESAKVVVYTRGWRSDVPMKDGEDPFVQLGSRIFVNGHEINRATGIVVDASNGDFVKATIELYPSELEFVPLTQDEWQALDKPKD